MSFNPISSDARCLVIIINQLYLSVFKGAVVRRLRVLNAWTLSDEYDDDKRY